MTYLKYFVLLFLVTFSSCSLINQATEIQNLFNCKFSLADVKIKKVGSVDVSKLKKGEKLPADVYFTLLKEMLAEKINTEFEFDISIYNPTERPAGSQGMEWLMLIRNEQFLEGAVDSAVYVAPKGKSIFKVKANLGLSQLVDNISVKELMNMLSENNWKEVWKQSGLEIKLKPWYKIGSTVKKYPEYITLKP